MLLWINRLGFALLASAFCVWCGSPPAAPAQGKGKVVRPGERVVLPIERDYLTTVGMSDSPLTVGTKINLVLSSGKRLDDQEITTVQPGKGKNTLRALGVKALKGAKRQNLKANTIGRIQVGDKSYDLLLDSESKDYVVLDVARRNEVVSERLSAQGERLWGSSTEATQEAMLQEYKKDYLDKVKAAFPEQEFQLHETKYFLFYTDLPAEQVQGYVTSLDRMYVELGRLFGILKETNIWRGKCVVIAFEDKADFQQCEVAVMGRPAGTQAQGLCHYYDNGKVVVTCYRGPDPVYFAHLIVHETTHGFLHLYRSTAHIPSWINEGLAEWVGSVVVTDCTAVPRRQRDAATRVQASGTMEGMFDIDTNIETWQYGLASGLAQFLIQTNPQAYGGLFTLIKEGATWQEALKELYGVTPAQLAAEYGRSIGVEVLRP